MKTKLISIIVSFVGLFALSGCDGTTMVYSEQINFTLSADCDEQGIKKIEGLYKNKNLPIGNDVKISIITEINSDGEQNKMALKQKVIDIVKRSSTHIHAEEFHALNSGATLTQYTASYPSDDEVISTMTTDFGNFPSDD